MCAFLQMSLQKPRCPRGDDDRGTHVWGPRLQALVTPLNALRPRLRALVTQTEASPQGVGHRL